MARDFCMTSPVTDNVDVDTIGNCGGAGLDIKPEEGEGFILVNLITSPRDSG